MLTTARRWTFYDDVYQARFYVYRCPYAAFVADGKRRWGMELASREPEGKAVRHTLKNGANIYIIWLPPSNRGRTPYHIGVVAHEVLHVVLDVLMGRGVGADIDHQEPYAYYLEWLLGQTLRRLRR